MMDIDKNILNKMQVIIIIFSDFEETAPLIHWLTILGNLQDGFRPTGAPGPHASSAVCQHCPIELMARVVVTVHRRIRMK